MKKEWNKNRKTSRYGTYYKTIMAPIWEEYWEQDLKRIRKLKKNLLSLGPVPEKEIQVIKTTNYFVKLINLLTAFIDAGDLKYAPEDKVEAVESFKTAVNFYVGRNESVLCYLNKSEIGKAVTHNNLYIGLFENISDEDITDDIQIKNANGFKFKVMADYKPIVDWLNKKVITIDGNSALISQKALVFHINEIRKDILNAVDSVLEEED